MIYTYNWLTDIDPYSTPTDELTIGTYWEYAANHFNGVMETDKWYKLTINDSGTNRSCLAYRSAHGNYDFAIWICKASDDEPGTYPSTLYADTATIATVNSDHPHYHYVGWINRTTGVPASRNVFYCYRYGNSTDVTTFDSYNLTDYPMLVVQVDQYSNMTSFGVMWVYKTNTSLWNPTIISPQALVVNSLNTSDYIGFDMYSSSDFVLCSEINGSMRTLRKVVSKIWDASISDSIMLLPIYNGEYSLDYLRIYTADWTICDELQKITAQSPSGKGWVENAIVVDNITYALKGYISDGNHTNILVMQ